MGRVQVDCDAVIRAWLAAQASLAAFFSGRIQAGVDLGSGIDPIVLGPCLLIQTRGGTQDPNRMFAERPLSAMSYGRTEGEARQADQAVGAVLDGAAFGPIYAVNLTVPGAIARDDHGWPYVFTTYQIIVAQPRH